MRSTLSTLVTALCVLSTCAAMAQTPQDAARYEPSLEKRADKRAEFNKRRTTSGKATTPDLGCTVDFVNRLPKRADLRVRVSQVGLANAYNEWVKTGKR